MSIEQLEDRLMLDAGGSSQLPVAIVLGRTLATPATAGTASPAPSYFVGEVQNNQLTITYTVYNEQADTETGVLLTTTLAPGVTLLGSAVTLDENTTTQLPDQSRQNLAWSLQPIQGYDRESVAVTIGLTSPIPLQLDTGAHAYATIDAGAVSASTPAATLQAGNVSNPALLASTPDANTTDPYIQEEAAALNYDPNQIFNFLHTQISYNSYLGSVRGARGTLWSNAGNALDVASLGIALMRASGIPAQYVSGTLSYEQAQTLILSMFPASYQTVGYIPSGTTTSDPADDSQLLSETESHYWFQFDTRGGMQDADPLMSGATIGQAFTAATGTFAEVPDALRETTEIQLQAEIYNSASALFGTSGLTTTTVLDHTFNDVDLVGRPLTIGNTVSSNTIEALAFSTTTNTYSPYIQLGDVAYNSSHDQNIVGDDYQEVLTNFPLGSQILTGLFLDISLSGPQGPTQTYERALVDRIGYAARQGLAPVNVSVAPGGAPILSDFDVFTLDVLAGLNDPSPVPTYQEDVQSNLQDFSDPAFQSLTPAEQATEVQGMSRVALVATTRDLANTFLSTSDAATAQIAANSLITAYFERPRLVLVSSRMSPDANDPNGLPLSIDLRRDTILALPYPGQDANASLIFNAVRGINETELEGSVLASYLEVQPDSVDDTASVFDAAAAQNIGLTLISPGDPTALDSLAISAQAKARISTALSLGNSVVVPTQAVNLNGTATIAWYEINPTTGETIGVTEDGGHQGILEGLTPLQLAILGYGTGSVVVGEIGVVVDCVFQAYTQKYIPEINAGFPQEKAQNDANNYFIQCVGKTNAKAGALLIAMGKLLLDALISFGVAVVHSLQPPPKPPAKPPHRVGSTPHRHGSSGGNSGSPSSVIQNPVNQPLAELTLANTDIQPTDASVTTDPIDYILDALASNVLGIEPSATFLNVPQGASTAVTNQASAEVTTGSAVAAGAVSGSTTTGSLSVVGQVTASWASVTTTSFTAQSLSAGAASVTAANGQVVGTGAVALASTSGVAVSVSGSVNYAVSGQASLSFYPPATGNLGVSADWSGFNATLSGTDKLELTTADLTLNGMPLPAGTYTVSTPSATIGGSGSGPAANSGGAVSIQVSGGTVYLGPGTGSLGVGGTPVGEGNGVSLTGFNGRATVTTGANADSVTLDGTTTQVLSVAGNPATVTANQNTPVSLNTVLRTSLADTYTVLANAPVGWSVTVSDTGQLTVLPAPGVQGGTFPIQLIVQSASDLALVAQAEVMVTVKPTTPAMSLVVNPDPEILVPYDGAQLPLSFQAAIHNSGPAADTYNLTFSNVPSGFTLLNSGTSITVPAGQTGILGLYLQPNAGQPLPAPGTVLSFNVTATSSTTSTITKTQTVTLTVPAIDAVTITGSPTSVNTTPGIATTDTLTITNVGNVPENALALAATSSGGLALSGLAPLSLAVDQSTTETVTLTPDASTPLNSTLETTITATYGPTASPQTQTLNMVVDVVVPGAQAIGNAATAATQLGDSDLANRLGDLSTAITNLVQNPSSAIYRSQSVADVNAIALLIGDDPFLAPLASTLTTDGVTLSQAGTASSIQSALTALSNELSTVNTTLSDEIEHNFTLSLVTNSQTAEPLSPATFQLTLQNTGSQTTTYDLTVSGLPSGVTAVFSQPNITLQPGQDTPGTIGVPQVTVTLTNSSTTNLSPFSFQVTATAEGASEITQSTTGSLTSRAALVQVVSVTPNPTFTQPGGQVDVSARILNAVNQEQQAEVSYTVMDSTGNVIFTSTPVTTTLQVLTTLSTVDIGNLDTTGFADGDDTINVIVTDASGNPIAGATGQGSLLIGSPVTATLTANTDQLPPGNGTVTDTLQVALNPEVVGSSNLVGQIQPPNGATTVATYGNYAYVGGNSGISIVDVTNPASPTVVKTFGASDLASGYVPYLTVSGSDLYVNSSNPNGDPESSLLIYSLADPLNPVLLGQAPLGNYYLFRGLTPYIDTADQHAYMDSFWIRYYLSSGDIFEQHGEIDSVNISDPTNPTVDGVVFNQPPSDFTDGNSNIWQESAVNSDTLLAASTTNTGSTLDGTGEVMVVDTANPSSPNLLTTVPVPGTVSLIGIAQESGSRAVALGTTGYWSPAPGLSLTGNLVLTTLDESNPENPTIIATVPLNLPSQSAGPLLPLGNNRFADISQSPSTGQEDVVIIDASDPNNPIVSTFPVPSTPNGLSVSGNLLYTTSSSGLLVYNLNASTSTTPVTAQVTVPINSVVANSYNIAPTTIISGTTTETLEWNLSLSQAQTSQTFTWQTSVSGLAPGQLQSIAQGGTVQFTSAGSNGTLTLPPLAVTGQQILGLTPATQTAAPGQAAGYTLNVDNPTSSAVTYDLALEGVPSSWSNLPTTVTVAAGGEQDLPFTLTSDAFTPVADIGFTVAATAGTTAGSVNGDLVLLGSPIEPDPDSHGIVASLTPASSTAGRATPAFYTVSLVNTGSAVETYSLTATAPPGFSVDLAQTTVMVPPGASNFLDVALTVTPGAGRSPGTVHFSVTASSPSDPSVSSTATGTLIVLSNGVKVTLNPPAAAPGSPYQMTVTNTGTLADTFKLALGGPAALVSKLANTAVTLAPGATQVIPISTTAVDFALAGSLGLTAIATSQNNPDVVQGASADLTISASTGMTAQFSPAAQTLVAPGTTTFLLDVTNTGNSEDRYSATIIGTTGPVTASLVSLEGLPTQSIALFRLPALSTGALALQANVTGPGQGTVTVLVKSLTTGQETTIIASINPIASTDGPRITLVQRYGIHMNPTTIVLTFDQPLDPTRAQDVHEYRLVDPQGQIVPIKSAFYDPATNTVTLHPRDRINLHHTYKLTVLGASPAGLTSSTGLLLDGKDSGKPGSNYVARINWRDLVLPPNWNPKWSHDPDPDKGRESARKPVRAVITGHHHLFQRSSTLVKQGSAQVAEASPAAPLRRPATPRRPQDFKRVH